MISSSDRQGDRERGDVDDVGTWGRTWGQMWGRGWRLSHVWERWQARTQVKVCALLRWRTEVREEMGPKRQTLLESGCEKGDKGWLPAARTRSRSLNKYQREGKVFSLLGVYYY